MDHLLCIELGKTNPPDADYCCYCGQLLARPVQSTEPRWGMFVRNFGYNEVVDNVHDSAESAVQAALEQNPQITESPMPFFVGLIGPDMRIHEWRPLTRDPEGRIFTIGDPTDHDEYLEVSYLESAPVHGND